ncbi:hypothetical protein Tsubulata_023713 [Turnera subulata]|uniref:Pentatricopeptide repeat-containing protein n=1 Tax=Turnera subulata TaxID=218843 RepID=A0A9Q0FN96_9ROSI|nr:hypothetical protein Tsubulata_023713 [Turnera subulata]
MLDQVLFSIAKRRPPSPPFTSFKRLYQSNSGHRLTEEQLYADRLRKCGESFDLNNGKSLHANFIKSSLSSSLYLINHLLNFYVKCGRLTDGLKVFDEMPERNVVSWSAIIAGFVQHGYPDRALSLFSGMHREGVVRPNEFTLVSALHACSLSEDLVQLYLVYGYIVRLGFGSNVFLVNAFLTSLIRHGKLLEGKRVFDECEAKDIVSWNALMAGLLQYCYQEIPGFWYRMSCEGVKPDNFTFATVLTGLAAINDLKLGLQVHSQVVKSGHGGEICVGNSLSDMYLKNQRVVDGFKVFNEMHCKDVCSWTQMAAGFLQCGEPVKALSLVAEMREMARVRFVKQDLPVADWGTHWDADTGVAIPECI